MKILILEFNNFHEEVIISQLDFLNDVKCDIHMFVHNEVKSKFNFDKNNIKINYFKGNSKLSRIVNLKNVKHYIEKHKFDLVLFNTYENIEVQILSYFIKQRKLAILHNADKIIKNKNKTDNRIDNFIVLNKTIYNTLKKSNSKMNISYFYPLINYQNSQYSHTEKDKIRIVIPGLVELSRRDYIGFINLLKDIHLNNNVEFVLLGNILKNDGPEVYRYIEQNNLLDYFKIFKGFIPYEEYFSMISSADLIMPLIHPNVENFNKYHHTKITAAFTMALSFKIPLILYKSFEILEEYRNFSFFYDFGSLEEKLKSLTKEEINKIKNKMRLSKDISYEEQKKRYINILSQTLKS